MSKKSAKKTQEPRTLTPLDAAISRVYEKYGTDLAAFYRDVHKDRIRNQKAPTSRASTK